MAVPWNRNVKEASLGGNVAKGTSLRWKVSPGTISSTFQRVERPRLLAWTGKGFGVVAIHVWRPEPRNDGTLVATEEPWEGLLSRILRPPFQKALKKVHQLRAHVPQDGSGAERAGSWAKNPRVQERRREIVEQWRDEG